MGSLDDDGFGPPLGSPDMGPSGTGTRPPRRPRERSGRGQQRDDFGPALQGRRKRTTGLASLPAMPKFPRMGRVRGRNVLRWGRRIVTLAIVLALILVGTGGALAVYASVQMNRVDVANLTPAPNGQMNVLVVGTDSREGLTPEQLQAIGTEQVSGQRTDSIFLLSVRGGAAALLSFPRDLFVTRCDGSLGRINAAYADGGPSCLVETVTGVSGIPVSHYMEVDFAGFVELVDSVGGVTVFLDEPMVDASAGVNLPAGCNTLNGQQAIGFVRARQVDDDLGRIARQQRFISELAQEIAAPATLVNLPRMFGIAGSGASALTADQGFGVIDLARLARAGRGLAGGGLATYTVPTTPVNVNGAAVLEPTEDATALFRSFADGSVLEVPSGEDLDPGDVTLDVLNAAGIEGLAARGRDVLTERGFNVAEVGNAEPVATTVVRHGPGFEAAAQLVASQFPGVVTEPSPGTDLALVLGPDAPALFDAGAAPAPPAPDPAAPPPPPPPADVPGATEPDALGAGEVPEEC